MQYSYRYQIFLKEHLSDITDDSEHIIPVVLI
jgi:hypothetical protein